MGMRTFVLILMLSLPAISAAQPDVRPLTSTELFCQVVELHFSECKTCERPKRGLPSARLVSHHEAGIVAACDRFWPGQEDMFYRMLAFLISEGNGLMKNNSPKGEKTHGPYCTSVEEVREVSGKFGLYPDIPCPKSASAIVERLETDPEWAALICAAVVKQYDREQRGDRVRGTLMYKIGGGRLCQICREHEGVPVTCISAWKGFSRTLDYLRCLRDRLMLANTPPCGCAAP